MIPMSSQETPKSYCGEDLRISSVEEHLEVFNPVASAKPQNILLQKWRYQFIN